MTKLRDDIVHRVDVLRSASPRALDRTAIDVDVHDRMLPHHERKVHFGSGCGVRLPSRRTPLTVNAVLRPGLSSR